MCVTNERGSQRDRESVCEDDADVCDATTERVCVKMLLMCVMRVYA